MEHGGIFCGNVGLGEDAPEPQDIQAVVGRSGLGCVPGGPCSVGGIVEDWLWNVVNEKPGMFGSWQKAVRVLGGLVFVGLLFWAAIYGLVKW